MLGNQLADIKSDLANTSRRVTANSIEVDQMGSIIPELVRQQNACENVTTEV